jgi:uncharacterized protein (UPF0276 family)
MRRLRRVRVMIGDRVGLGWRGDLSAQILANLEAIEVLEVIAEDWMHAPPRTQRALRALQAERPVILHGVALGLASCASVESRRADAMARLVEVVHPESWSEHLAFVRAGGVEIGHLAAPPRSPSTVEGALANLERVRRAVGTLPAVENIATLIDPPASPMAEGEWTRQIVEGSGAALLLDLHNLYANAVNFAVEPRALLASMPLASVRMIHLSGGRWLRPANAVPRLLDDHLHDVPDPVYELLEEVAARVGNPLTVILERDGNYPEFAAIRTQLDHARSALQAGRARASVREAA